MKYICEVCNWEYDEEQGYPEGGIAPGTKWENVPEDFECPLCFVGKETSRPSQSAQVFLYLTRLIVFLSIILKPMSLSLIVLCNVTGI